MQLHMQADGMRIKTIVTALVVILLCIHCISFFPFTEICRADVPPTLYVGEGETYTRIQDAIDNASNGYRIFVYDGTYTEQLTIDKKIDLFGEDCSITIIDGDESSIVITINASHVNISHFTIKNSDSNENDCLIQVNYGNSIITDNILSNGHHGIILNHSDHHLIYDNTIQNNDGDGIRLNRSDNNVNISYNIIKNNNNGIYLSSSDGNKIYNNVIQNNDANGIFLNNSCGSNQISNNNVTNNDLTGIYLNDYSNDSTISNNEIHHNGISGLILENSSWNLNINGNIVNSNTNYGIMIVGSNNIIQSNTVSHNSKDGFYLTADDNNTVSSNTIGYNTLAGIRLYNSTADYICTNKIFNNSQYGAYLDFFTINNQIYNNYFHDNTKNAVDKSMSKNNTWNIAKISGTNIVGGGNISGNYWDNYDEISEYAYDTDGDGIADSAYTIYASNKDNGPLLDATDPVIGGLQATPSTQYSGSDTNISVTVTDTYLGVEEVYLVYTDPDEQITNISITQNRTENTYYCNRSFTTVGSYSYHIEARDKRNWVSSDVTTFEILPAADTQAPTIVVVDYGPSFDETPNSHTFGVVVTDNVEVANVTIEYWYSNASKMTTEMENAVENYYEKVLIPQGSPDKVYCVIYANDTSGNQRNTKNPYAEADGSYIGYVASEITFNGTGSFDLDGNISTYTWNFGDGTTGTNASSTHIYSAKGTYAVSLTVTDNDGNTNTDTATVTVIPFTKVTASDATVDLVEAHFDVTLSDAFYCHDTNGDEVVDTFTDPNGILTLGHYVNISGHASFLISVNDDLGKLFIWDTEDGDITNVTYSIATITNTVTNVVERTITVTVSVNKSGWTYINLTDPYPDNENLTVKTSSGTTISEDMVWRGNVTIFVLDDPSTVYYFIYDYAPPPLEHPSFTIGDGGIINESNPTITVVYNVSVTIVHAEFYNYDTKETYIINLSTSDSKTFTYTPPATFESGQYEFFVWAKDQYGDNVNDSMVYNFVSYGEDGEEVKDEASYDILLLFLGGIIAFGVALFLILRYKHITLESFIYFRNRKIIPFFKPVVFGPLSIDVDDEKVKKAEFYVNGQLKDTLTEAPYVWRWNEGAFMKKTIETKVYDKDGNEHSSDGMTFYVFNSPRLFK